MPPPPSVLDIYRNYVQSIQHFFQKIDHQCTRIDFGYELTRTDVTIDNIRTLNLRLQRFVQHIQGHPHMHLSYSIQVDRGGQKPVVVTLTEQELRPGVLPLSCGAMRVEVLLQQVKHALSGSGTLDTVRIVPKKQRGDDDDDSGILEFGPRQVIPNFEWYFDTDQYTITVSTTSNSSASASTSTSTDSP